MLDSLSDRVNECYRCAAECRERATRASNSSMEAMFLKLEQRWLELAHNCELDESSYRLAEAARHLRDRRWPPIGRGR